MAKRGRRSGLDSAGGRREDSRQKVVAAAFETLRQEGFAGASARSIADRGGFNQAQVFYYFGTVNELLLAALEQSSTEQLTAYREALDGVDDLSQLFEVVGARHDADLASGHVKVLAELIGGSGSDPDLRARVAELVEPWLQLTEAVLNRVLGSMGLSEMVPGDQLAFLVVSLFLGMELLVNLTGDQQQALGALAMGGRVAALFAGVRGPSGAPS